MSEATGAAPADGAARRTEFHVNDRRYTLEPFKGSKGVRALAVLRRIGENAQVLLKEDADYTEEYKRTHVRKITRDMAEYRVAEASSRLAALEKEARREDEDEMLKAAGQSDLKGAERVEFFENRRLAILQMISANEAVRDDWRFQLDGPLKESAEIEIPREPSWQVRLLARFPTLWAVAEPEMTMLLGLALIPNADLKKARQEGGDGGPDAAIMALGEDLLDELEIDEIGELILTTIEVAYERMESRGGNLGKRVADLWQKVTGAPDSKEERAEREAEAAAPAAPVVGGFIGREDEEDGSSDSNETSSTDSPEPTDGTPSELSSEPSGVTS